MDIEINQSYMDYNIVVHMIDQATKNQMAANRISMTLILEDPSQYNIRRMFNILLEKNNTSLKKIWTFNIIEDYIDDDYSSETYDNFQIYLTLMFSDSIDKQSMLDALLMEKLSE